MIEPRPPLTVSRGYPVVNCEVSSKIQALVWAGTMNSFSGNSEGIAIPAARTTLPADTGFISIGGRGSDTSCKLLGESVSPFRAPRPRDTAFIPDPFRPESLFQDQSNLAASSRSPGSAA